MRLDLRFTNRPPEELWCQAVVMLSFRVRDNMSPFLDSIDKKMTGSIRNIVNSGIWSGERGDKLLFATQNSIKADKLLIHGLGEESMYSIEVLEREIDNAGHALIKMDINEFGLQIPEISAGETDFDIYIETAVKNLVRVYLDKYRDVHDYILKIYIIITSDCTELVEKAADRLRHDLSSLTEISIILDKAPAGYQVAGVSEMAA